MSDEERGLDIRIIAERVAEVVNRKLKIFDQRMSEYESRLKELELMVRTMGVQTIESVLKSALAVKSEDIASSVAARVSSEFSKSIEDVVRVAEEFRGAADAIRDAVKGLGELSNELKALPERVVEALKSVKPSVQIDTSGIKTIVSGEMSKLVKSVGELTERIGTIENTMNELSANLADSLATSIREAISRHFESMEKILEDIKESADYSKDMWRKIEEGKRKRRERAFEE